MKATLSPASRFFIFSFFLGTMSAFSFSGWALDPQHRVAGSYGGTRLYAHDSVVISPNAFLNPYSQTTTGASTLSANVTHKDTMCRSIINKSDKDYFVPWRTAATPSGAGGSGAGGFVPFVERRRHLLALASGAGVNEWKSFLDAVAAGSVEGVEVHQCCYPRLNPNKPCGAEYHLGKRKAGALPAQTPDSAAMSAEVSNYGAVGDISNDVVTGYNRRETWACGSSGEWINTNITGGCYRDGACNNYDSVTNPTGYNGASINAIPSGNALQASLMCNGVVPTKVSGGNFPYPENDPSSPFYGTGGWKWKCPGQDGGSFETCSATYNNAPLNAVCGDANNRVYTSSPPESKLCRVGEFVVPTLDPNTGKWIWTCFGINGGNKASCQAITANAASCGTYDKTGGSRRPNGLLGFEVADGKPISTGLCSVGSYGDVEGNGTTSSPWTWQCYQTANNTFANCSNTYTKSGQCGVANGMAFPVAPTVSSVTCTSGRWYNKADIIGLAANKTVWNPSTKKWTWVCLGYNQATGMPSNALCEASLCQSCEGTSASPITTGFSGSYDDCLFSEDEGSLQVSATIKRQDNPDDVTVPFSFSAPHGNGLATFKTTQVTGYCPPCYNKVIGISSATATINSPCVLSPPRNYSAMPAQ